MEEAAQVLEVETLIPMLLQKHATILGANDNSKSSIDSISCRLKRVVLIG